MLPITHTSPFRSLMPAIGLENPSGTFYQGKLFLAEVSLPDLVVAQELLGVVL